MMRPALPWANSRAPFSNNSIARKQTDTAIFHLVGHSWSRFIDIPSSVRLATLVHSPLLFRNNCYAIRLHAAFTESLRQTWPSRGDAVANENSGQRRDAKTHLSQCQ